jgi:inhibitor of cysteine peptidase
MAGTTLAMGWLPATALALAWPVPVPAAADGPAGPAGGQAMDRSVDGQTVTVAQGATLMLSLPLNAGTGYEWRLLRRPTAMVDVAEAATTAAERPGARIEQRFAVTGIAPGQATLAFGLLRPWESGVPPVEQFTVTIDVTRP